MGPDQEGLDLRKEERELEAGDESRSVVFAPDVYVLGFFTTILSSFHFEKSDVKKKSFSRI